MNTLSRAVRALVLADYVLYSSGAGMGVDSGLPDFRGNQGFWNNYPPYRGKFNFTECANPQFLQTNPRLFWGFYGHRLAMYRQKQPHQGYAMLKRIADKKQAHFCFTSNVDGHFNRVFGEEHVYEVHGSIHFVQCTKCGGISPNTFEVDVDLSTMAALITPKCCKCGSEVRPNILMFNDYDWDSERADQQAERLNRFVKGTAGSKLAMVEIGAGTAIPTIRNMNERILARNHDASLIRINPDEEQGGYDFNGRLINIKGAGLAVIKQLYEEYLKSS